MCHNVTLIFEVYYGIGLYLQSCEQRCNLSPTGSGDNMMSCYPVSTEHERRMRDAV